MIFCQSWPWHLVGGFNTTVLIFRNSIMRARFFFEELEFDSDETLIQNKVQTGKTDISQRKQKCESLSIFQNKKEKKVQNLCCIFFMGYTVDFRETLGQNFLRGSNCVRLSIYSRGCSCYAVPLHMPWRTTKLELFYWLFVNLFVFFCDWSAEIVFVCSVSWVIFKFARAFNTDVRQVPRSCGKNDVTST